MPLSACTGAPETGLEALALMEDALAKLDAIHVPHQIGAHLDLAICQVGEQLDVQLPSSPLSPGACSSS